VSVQKVALWCVCVFVCCVRDSLEQVWGNECAAGSIVVCVCVLCVGQFRAGLGIECAAGGFVVCVCVCLLRMGQFGVGLGE